MRAKRSGRAGVYNPPVPVGMYVEPKKATPARLPLLTAADKARVERMLGITIEEPIAEKVADAKGKPKPEETPEKLTADPVAFSVFGLQQSVVKIDENGIDKNRRWW